jgi:hypothetical protein
MRQPRADSDWMPPHLPDAMRERGAKSLSERIGEAIIWSAEAATTARHTKAAIYPQAPFRDAAWSILLRVLIGEVGGTPVTVAGLAVLEELSLGKGRLWVEIMERLGLVAQFASSANSAQLVRLTPAARQVMLKLLLEPDTWNGPLLTQNITVSQLWRLTCSQNSVD